MELATIIDKTVRAVQVISYPQPPSPQFNVVLYQYSVKKPNVFYMSYNNIGKGERGYIQLFMMFNFEKRMIDRFNSECPNVFCQ